MAMSSVRASQHAHASVGHGTQKRVTNLANALIKPAMQKPSGRNPLVGQGMQYAKDPESAADFIFNIVIIARAVMSAPPFAGNALGPGDMNQTMHVALPVELPRLARAVIRRFADHANFRRRLEQRQRPWWNRRDHDGGRLVLSRPPCPLGKMGFNHFRPNHRYFAQPRPKPLKQPIEFHFLFSRPFLEKLPLRIGQLLMQRHIELEADEPMFAIHAFGFAADQVKQRRAIAMRAGKGESSA